MWLNNKTRDSMLHGIKMCTKITIIITCIEKNSQCRNEPLPRCQTWLGWDCGSAITTEKTETLIKKEKFALKSSTQYNNKVQMYLKLEFLKSENIYKKRVSWSWS